jgi:beta-lactamase regulating signal transducer with metallopeptidase domain
LSAFDSNELIVNDEVLVNPQTRAMGDFRFRLKQPVICKRNMICKTNAESIENVQPVTSASEIREQSQRSGTLLTPQIVDSVLIIWIAGVLLFLFRLVIGLTSTKLLTQRASKFNEPKVSELFSSLLKEFNLKKTVRLLHSKRTLMPVVCGIFRPVVLLPADANNWSEERLRMVLLHELAHVARRDCLTQMLAQTACAFYWFNPFVWSAAAVYASNANKPATIMC